MQSKTEAQIRDEIAELRRKAEEMTEASKQTYYKSNGNGKLERDRQYPHELLNEAKQLRGQADSLETILNQAVAEYG